MPKPKLKQTLIAAVIFLAIFYFTTYWLQLKLISLYQKQQSPLILDRQDKIIAILPNSKGYYAYYLNSLPQKFKELLIKKEDKFFYYHPGFNPKSMFEALLTKLGFGQRKGSSTITQQLVKNLLEQELERNIKNKLIETIYAISLETHQSKNDILKMYANSLYLGNSVQGIQQASKFYFGLPPELLSQGQILQLLASISSPSKNNPEKTGNQQLAINLSKQLGLKPQELTFYSPKEIKAKSSDFQPIKTAYFEISSFLKNKNFQECQTFVDLELTKKIREIVKRNIDKLTIYNAKNTAVIVLKLPENQILALIGSPEPSSFEESYKIDMLHQERAVGSTIKPLIYLKAFEKNLRPYTLVDDREYKYTTAIDLPLYPKNFDLKYRGIVSLHYALSNSLNVPTVKVLEYIGLENFYNFLAQDLSFQPVQDFEDYQLGIALGALEMKPIELAKYFTIFANQGRLKDINLAKQNSCQPKQDHLTKAGAEKIIADEQYIQLINKILSDRKTGIEQFGLKSELNLSQNNYALKTGTSRDFRDSWIIGYTPDFLVGVWVGNADNSPTEELSGQIGAGRIWHEIMELMFNTEYNKKTAFQFDLVKQFQGQGQIEYGLGQDNYQEYKNLLLKQDEALIFLPHQGDVFFLEQDTKIILRAKEKVDWLVNGRYLETATSTMFEPRRAGVYDIKAQSQNGDKESVNIQVLN